MSSAGKGDRNRCDFKKFQKGFPESMGPKNNYTTNREQNIIGDVLGDIISKMERPKDNAVKMSYDPYNDPIK